MVTRNPVEKLLAEKRDAAPEVARDNAKWAEQTEEKARRYRATEAASNRLAAFCDQAIADIKAADNRRVIYGREVLQ